MLYTNLAKKIKEKEEKNDDSVNWHLMKRVKKFLRAFDSGQPE